MAISRTDCGQHAPDCRRLCCILEHRADGADFDEGVVMDALFTAIFETYLPGMFRTVGSFLTNVRLMNIPILSWIIGLAIVSGVIALLMSFRPSAPVSTSSISYLSTKHGLGSGGTPKK